MTKTENKQESTAHKDTVDTPCLIYPMAVDDQAILTRIKCPLIILTLSGLIIALFCAAVIGYVVIEDHLAINSGTRR